VCYDKITAFFQENRRFFGLFRGKKKDFEEFKACHNVRLRSREPQEVEDRSQEPESRKQEDPGPTHARDDEIDGIRTVISSQLTSIECNSCLDT
jgi:hypothetical protein